MYTPSKDLCIDEFLCCEYMLLDTTTLSSRDRFDELMRLGARTRSIADAITHIINVGFGVCQICAYLVIKMIAYVNLE